KVMTGATAAMIGFSLLLTVLAGPIMTYSNEAAASVLERVPYVSSVLGDDAADALVYKISEDGQRVEDR
ncbi:MAG: Na+/H+ antiporter subunit D, partial [Brachybacterium tyrofermentans]